MPGRVNGIIYADNCDFSGANRALEANGLATDGQLWIGRTAVNAGGTHVDVATLTAGPGVTITNGPGSIMISSSGGVTLETDSGSVTGSTIPLNGQLYGETVPVVDTFVDTGVAYVENRAWQTPYVVDPDTDPGQRGTFETIPDAIADIVASGYVLSGHYTTIFIRRGSYSPDIVIPANLSIAFQAYGPVHDSGSSVADGVIITGGVTFASNADGFYANGIEFTGLVDTDNCTEFKAENCRFTEIVMQSSIDHEFNNCDLSIVTASTNSPVGLFNNCLITDVLTLEDSSQAFLSNCGYSTVSMSDTAELTMTGCVANSGATGTISLGASNIATVTNHVMGDGDLFSGTGTITYSNVSFSSLPFYNNIVNVATTPASLTVHPTSSGGIMRIRNPGAFSTIDGYDQYVGLNPGASDTVFLQVTSGNPGDIRQGQIITIKDESGTAATNTITIAPSDGGSLIDDNADYVLGTNYGSVTLLFDGTNFWTI